MVAAGIVRRVRRELHYTPASVRKRKADRNSEVTSGRRVRVSTIRVPSAIEAIGREDSVGVAHGIGRHSVDLVPTTEGFYDTAPNEAVEFESRTANDTPAPLEVQRKVCPKGLA